MPREQRPATVEIDGWGWQHAGRSTWAVRDVTASLQPGERVLLLGASGAGKSTLLQALAGVLGGEEEGVEEGRLLVDGAPPASRRGVAGLVMQDPDAQVVLNRVGDDVAFGCENLRVPRDEIWPRVREALADVGLDVALDRSTQALSGGQRQRLVLAGVMAMRPGLLLLDEPTANLDPAGAVAIRDAVARVVADRSATLVVVEHNVEPWVELVDRVIVLGTGGLLADGPPAEVFEARRDELAAAGVWVPGLPEPAPVRQPPAPAGYALRGDDLVIGYEAAHPVLSLERVEVPLGLSSVIVGPNGAGKSTLALTLAGLLRKLGGRVEAAPELRPRGLPDPTQWRSRDLLTRIGTVFQEPEHQFVTASVRDEIAVGLRALRWQPDRIRAAVDELLQRLRLDALAGANPFTLSGGEKRRLSVATVLAASPAVIVLDEPTFGQDRVTWAELVELVGELLAQGRTIVSVTHDERYQAALGECRIALGGAA